MMTASDVTTQIADSTTRYTTQQLDSPVFGKNYEGKPTVKVNSAHKKPFQLSRTGLDYLCYRTNQSTAPAIWDYLMNGRYDDATALMNGVKVEEQLIFATQNNVLYGVLTSYVPVSNTQLVDTVGKTFPEQIVRYNIVPTRFDVFVQAISKSKSFGFRIMITNGETGHVTLRYSSVAHHVASDTDIVYEESSRKRRRHLAEEGITQLFDEIGDVMKDATYNVRFENAAVETITWPGVVTLITDKIEGEGVRTKAKTYLEKIFTSDRPQTTAAALDGMTKAQMIDVILNAAANKGDKTIAARIAGLILENVSVK